MFNKKKKNMSKKDEPIRFPDNWSPNRVTQKPKSDDSGKTDTFYSDKGDKTHGHTVVNPDGSVDYARTMDGTVLKDNSKKGS